MTHATRLSVGLGLLLFLGIASITAGESSSNEERLWKPVEDNVYLQEFGEQIATSEPVTSVVASDAKIYAIVGGSLCALSEGALQPVTGAPKDAVNLYLLKGEVWAIAKAGVYRLADGAWRQITDRPFVDLCIHLGTVYGAAKDALFRLENGAFIDMAPEKGYLSNDSTMLMEDGTQLLADPVKIGPIDKIASYNETIYMLRRGGLTALDGVTPVDSPLDWGKLPSPRARAIMALGSCLYIATDRGVGVVRGAAASALRGEDGLPYEDTTCLTRGFYDDLWIGTTGGAIRKIDNGFQFFGANLWLPDNNVHDIAVDGKTVYIATDAGLGIIRYEPYTLQKKAAYYEQQLDEWGMKRLGFIHMVDRDASSGEWIREVSDNDGGHTAFYLAAMSFKYAATGDPKAREEAVDAFKAMAWLGQITHTPGFIARSIWSVKGDKGKKGERGSGGLPAKWNPTPDGNWAWKGDTSSDEVNGHMHSVSVFYDLVAKDAEKEAAKKHIVDMATHILDNGWVLRDADGKPTRWGRWDPQYLLRPYGFSAAGLNGMEAQTYMRLAYGLSGDQKFQDGFEQLVKLGYPKYTLRQKLTFPQDLVTTWDDELAFRCYYPLLRNTSDPALRSIYVRSLQRSWETLRLERVAWFNFIYGALTGNDCESEEAASFLRECPVEVRSIGYQNSHRSDLRPQPGRPSYTTAVRAFSPRETETSWGSESALREDGGGHGNHATPPVGWLESYWMARYHGMIEAPTTTDPNLTAIPPSTSQRKGAAAYDGPPRPANIIPGQP